MEFITASFFLSDQIRAWESQVATFEWIHANTTLHATTIHCDIIFWAFSSPASIPRSKMFSLFRIFYLAFVQIWNAIWHFICRRIKAMIPLSGWVFRVLFGREAFRFTTPSGADIHSLPPQPWNLSANYGNGNWSVSFVRSRVVHRNKSWKARGRNRSQKGLKAALVKQGFIGCSYLFSSNSITHNKLIKQQ